MKTKFMLLIALTAIFTTKICSAQSGLIEARLDLGYGFTSGPGSRADVSGSTYTDVPYSMGMGFNVALSGTYFFGDHLGAGLDLNAVAGTETKFTENDGADQITEKMKGDLFSITPFLVLSAHNSGINPYGRFGIVIGAPTATISETAAGPFAPTGTYILTASGNIAVGVYGAFGVEYPLNDNLALNLEIFDRSLQWEPAQVENTQAYDGDPKDKTITYSTKVTNMSPTNQVASYSTVYSPFSSVGIKVGITMKFGAQ